MFLKFRPEALLLPGETAEWIFWRFAPDMSDALSQASLDPAKAITQYVWQTWQSGSGLPHNIVMAMAQTPDGLCVVGKEEGLARFDGDR